MTLLVREYTYNNFLRKLASECILIEMSGRVGQIKVKAPVGLRALGSATSCTYRYRPTVGTLNEYGTVHRQRTAVVGPVAVGKAYSTKFHNALATGCYSYCFALADAAMLTTHTQNHAQPAVHS